MMDGIHYTSMQYLRLWGACAYASLAARIARQTVIHASVVVALAVYSLRLKSRWQWR